MDTLSFIRTILPESGVKYVMRLVPRQGKPDFPVHTVFETAEEVADEVLALDSKYPEHNIYYAMASFKEVQHKTTTTKDGREFTFVVGRKQDNVAAVKSLWIDWDVGKDNPNSYPTRQEAMDALKKYVKASGLPVPIIVSSGYGLHSYWVMTDEVPADVWADVAQYQRMAMRHLGVKFDPSRDMDSASVLRPPGCANKKAGKPDQPVQVLKGEVNALPAQELKRRLKGYCDANNLTATVSKFGGARPEWTMKAGGSLAAVEFYEDSYVDIAMPHCKQMQEFAQTGGASEVIWYNCLGLLKHFVEGEHYAHEYASKYEAYDELETQTKIDQWNYGPTSCDKFREINPSACQGCKMTCKSPIQLGHTDKVEKPNIMELAQASNDATVEEVAASEADVEGTPFCWPERFGFDKKNVYAKVQDANGVWQDVSIATPLFYPVEQIRDEDGTFVLRMHMWPRPGVLREFKLPTRYTADAKNLKIQLANYQIHVINDKMTAQYLSTYMISMQSTTSETETYRQMGWQHDFKGFLIGDKLITEKEERQVVVSKLFPSDLKEINVPTGTREAWVNAVDTLYNREYGEPYQFAICAAFAAPLHDLLGFSEWRGIPYAITTDESGFGKTTVNMIAQSIWCDPEKSKISESTPKATLAFASAFNSVPFLLDEVTQYLKDPADMASVLYAMSNGRPRHGMEGSGKLRESMPPWTGCCAMTGNRNILLQLAENKLLPEATQMRVFEIDLDTYPRLTAMDKRHPDYAKFNAEHSALTKTLPAEHHSIIGVDYVRHIMKNIDEVREKLRKTSMAFSKLAEGDATKERFYYHLITTALVGGYYAKKLGFINFNMNNLRDWCIQHVTRLRGNVNDTRRTPKDHYAALMSEMTGRLLVTRNYDSLDARSKKFEDHKGPHIRGNVVGRYVAGDEKERPKLFVALSAIQQWCSEQGISLNTLRRDFLRERIIRLGTKGVNRETGAIRVNIGKGVNGYQTLGNPWCWELDVDQAEGLPATVTDLDEKRAEAQAPVQDSSDDELLTVDL